MSLQEEWNTLCTSLNLDGLHSWTKIEESYSKNQLAYHNLTHIADCLSKFRASQHLAQDPAAIELAIWFHDIVYDPKASDNEEQSARRAESFLLDSPLTTRVTELILDTSHRQEAETSDGKLICDIDLSILGSDPKSYRSYADAIREEYSWVNSTDYMLGRSQVLENFLNRKRIFALPYFEEKYEQQARLNLSEELESLTSC
ncbi:MAG: HD domain-containing protein [Roseibacillus sp.]